MPFDAELAARLKRVVIAKFSDVTTLVETRMFGGFGYMLNGNMCIGIHRDTLIVRIGADAAETMIHEPHVRPMDLTGKVMKGWATIEPKAIENDSALTRFCQLAISYVRELPAKQEKSKK